MFTHIVLYKLKNPSEENKKALQEKFQSMVGNVPQIRSLESGTDGLGLDRSFDVSLYVKFDSKTIHSTETLPNMCTAWLKNRYPWILNNGKRKIAGKGISGNAYSFSFFTGLRFSAISCFYSARQPAAA